MSIVKMFTVMCCSRAYVAEMVQLIAMQSEGKLLTNGTHYSHTIKTLDDELLCIYFEFDGTLINGAIPHHTITVHSKEYGHVLMHSTEVRNFFQRGEWVLDVLSYYIELKRQIVN